MRIFLVRHGQTFSNVEHLLDTRPPGAELTERGREQATAVGTELSQLADAAVPPRFLSSVAIRAQQTAMAAVRAFEEDRDLAPHSLPVEPVMGLHEIFAGKYEMSGSEDALREYTNALRGWLDGDATAAMEGGETLTDVLNRYRPVLEGAVAAEETVAANGGIGRDLVVFTHGAAIRVVTAHACGVDPDFAFTGYMPNCRFTVMETHGRDFGEWELLRWADLELGAEG